ncbi:MAG: hypothetical protein GY834_15770 [Bacteroidetes bacterium]|nr:hypothetical protein [Bacteroidota bacterium]
MNELHIQQLFRRVKYVGYQYSEIFRNLSNIFLSGGDVIEDINTHFGEHLKSILSNNVPSANTVLRALKELTTENTHIHLIVAKQLFKINTHFFIISVLNKISYKTYFELND